jgi:anti-anti-sigma regulatory factor
MQKTRSVKKRSSVKRVSAKRGVADTAGSVVTAPADAVRVADVTTPVEASDSTPLHAGPCLDDGSSASLNAASVAADVSVGAVVQLEHSLEIKDVEVAHRRLTAALDRVSTITVDMSRVGTTDTAGVQLLLALRGEAVKRGVSLEFRGESAAFIQALTVLGLRDAFQIASSRD